MCKASASPDNSVPGRRRAPACGGSAPCVTVACGALLFAVVFWVYLTPPAPSATLGIIGDRAEGTTGTTTMSARTIAFPTARHMAIPENCSTGIGLPLDVPRYEACFAELEAAAAGAGVSAGGIPNVMCPPTAAGSEQGSMANEVEAASCGCHAAGGEPPLLVHLVPEGGGLPPSASRLFVSFIATQCCSSQLWLWLDDAALKQLPTPQALVDHFGLPAQHARRFRVRRLDALALWRRVVARGGGSDIPGPWPEFSGLPLDALPGPLAASPRLLVAAAWGGVLVDRYSILLRDLSPLLAPPNGESAACAPAFFYRWSSGPAVYPAMFHLGCAERSAFTRTLLAQVAAKSADLPAALTAALAADARDRAANRAEAAERPPRLFPSLLFDPIWMRHDGAEAPAVLAAHLPEVRNMLVTFERTEPPPPSPPATAAASFFRGVFSHNWHHRELEAAPGSWAATLDAGFREIAAAKVCP